MNKPIKRAQSELVHIAEREVSRTEFNKPIKRAQSELVHIAEREVSRTESNKPIKRAQKVQLPYTEGTVLTVYFLVPVGGPLSRSRRGTRSEVIMQRFKV